jgi:cytochrome b
VSGVSDRSVSAIAGGTELESGQPIARSSGWIRVWDLPLRLFHWTLVAAIAVSFLSAEEDSVLNEWHVLSGWLAAILIVFRLVWGFVGGEHSRFSDFIRPSRIPAHISGLLHGRRGADLGHNPLGALAVVTLLALTTATVWTGAFGGEAAEELHETIGWTLLAMITLHVVAVVVMSLVERENLARAMVTGDKPAARHPGAVDAKPPRGFGLILALLAIVGAAYAILRYDPQAFSLRTLEAFEHRADGGAGETRFEQEHGERD